MKALKKVIVIVLTALMLTSMLAISASAKAPATDYAPVCTVSADEIRYQIAEGIADTANAAIEALVAKAQASSHPNINKLIRRTETISAIAISMIRMLGLDAECEYVEYEIGGQTVEIDPIIVIKRD